MLNINTNYGAAFAAKAAKNSSASLNTAFERLSSGSRINFAKDDAAGQGIATRLAAEVKGLEMASWLFERYPEEITIVMQNWFDNLEVNDAGFAVTLNFGNNPELLYVPYGAITTFVDPSVEFGVRFEQTNGSKGSEDAPLSINQGEEEQTGVEQDQQDENSSAKSETANKLKADVVSLDAFRKS